MKKIQKQYINKAINSEKKITKEKWGRLKEIIRESGLPIKNDSKDEMFIKIEGETKADIELYPTSLLNGGFVVIHLWYYDFQNETLARKYKSRKNELSGIPEALERINSILWDIQRDKQYQNFDVNQ